MTSAMSVADAYDAWLGIPPAQHPPHHYALLGLPDFSADEQTIFNAYQQRAALVGPYLQGPQAATAKRLLGELAAAQACLLSADAKAAYDHWLHERLQHSPPSGNAPSAAGVSRPAPRSKSGTLLAVAPPDTVEPPPVSYSAEVEEPSSVLPWLIGGVCAGLLAVAVLGVALFGFSRARRTPSAHGPTASANSANAQRAERRTLRALRDEETAAANATNENDVLGDRVAPLTTAPEHLRLDGGIVGPPATSIGEIAAITTDDREPDASASSKVTPTDTAPKPDPSSSSPKPTTPASTAGALARMPRSFALPARDSRGAAGVLAELPLKDAETIQLKLETKGVPNARSFVLGDGVAGSAPGERLWPIEHRAADGAIRAVGEYIVAGDELRFRWADSAQASDEALANAALAVTVGDDVVLVNQRSPEVAAPLKLAVNSGAISTSTTIEARPPEAKIYFAVDRQDKEFPPHLLQPSEPVEVDGQIDIVFGEATDPYRLAMRVAVVENSTGTLRIEARPMIHTAGKGEKWDYFRPKSVLQTLAQLKQQEALIDAQLTQMQERSRRNSLQLQQATELYNRQAAELQTGILTIEKLHALCEELNEQGKLHYRVFAKFGDREVELLDSSLGITLPVAEKPAETPPSDDDASAIVGPPIASPAGVAPPEAPAREDKGE
jgi:hypothetical protein